MHERNFSPDNTYQQLPLGKPFELYSKHRHALRYNIRPSTHYEIVRALEQAGRPINLRTDEDSVQKELNYTVFPYTASTEGLADIQAVMKDPQIVAMEEARSFKGIGTDAGQDLADLRAKLEEFSWPRERTVDYLIVEALESASETYFDLISQGRQLAHTFHHPVNRVNEERYHQKGMTFRREAEALRTRIPEEKAWQKGLTVTDLQHVVATAVNRIFGDTTTTG